MGIVTAQVQRRPPADADALDVNLAVKKLLVECWNRAEQRPSMIQCAHFLRKHIDSAKRGSEVFTGSATLATESQSGWKAVNVLGVTESLDLQRVEAFDDVEGHFL